MSLASSSSWVPLARMNRNEYRTLWRRGARLLLVDLEVQPRLQVTARTARAVSRNSSRPRAAYTDTASVYAAVFVCRAASRALR
jgi:hypothetical protein